MRYERVVGSPVKQGDRVFEVVRELPLWVHDPTHPVAKLTHKKPAAAAAKVEPTEEDVLEALEGEGHEADPGGDGR